MTRYADKDEANEECQHGAGRVTLRERIDDFVDKYCLLLPGSGRPRRRLLDPAWSDAGLSISAC